MKIFLIILAVAYSLWPFDLLSDMAVGVGWLDDIALWGLLWWFFKSIQKKEQMSTDYFERQSVKQQSTSKQAPSPHEILGVTAKSSQAEIKSAYRKLINQYHPDKVGHLGKEFKELAHERFMQIQSAYQTLSNN